MNECHWNRIASLWVAMHSNCISRNTFLTHLYGLVSELDYCPYGLTELSETSPEYDFEFLKQIEQFLGRYASDPNLVFHAIALAFRTELASKRQLIGILSDQFIDDETLVLNCPSERLNDLNEEFVAGKIDSMTYSNEIADELSKVD